MNHLELKYLARNKNLLVLADEKYSNFADVFACFKAQNKQNINDASIDTLSSTLISRQIDVLVVQQQKDYGPIFEIINSFKKYTPDLIVFAVLCEGVYYDSVVNSSDFVITKEASVDELTVKLYNALSDLAAYTKSIHDPEFSSSEMEIIYLCKSLDKIAVDLDSGDISKTVLDQLIVDLQKIQGLLSDYMIQSKKVGPTIEEFTAFMQETDFKRISIESIEGFSYMARITEDISVFLKKHFLDREFGDIYIIEDSLQNSIDAMKRIFKDPHSDDGSQMELF